MIKNAFWCKIFHKTASFYTLHTDTHNRPDDISKHHKPHFLKSQVFSSLFTTWSDPQRSVSPWSAWRPEASAPRRSRPRRACRKRQRSGRRLFSNSDRGTSMCAARRHSAKTRHLTPRHSPQEPAAPQRQTTGGKTCCFVTAYPEPKFISIPLCFFTFSSTTVLQTVENTV